MRSDDSVLWLMAPQEEMAAASLDVNFKEELSAIEQCTPRLLSASQATSSPIVLIQGSKSFLKQSAQPLFTVFCNILRKFKLDSSSRSFSKWLGLIP